MQEKTRAEASSTVLEERLSQLAVNQDMMSAALLQVGGRLLRACQTASRPWRGACPGTSLLLPHCLPACPQHSTERAQLLQQLQQKEGELSNLHGLLESMSYQLHMHTGEEEEEEEEAGGDGSEETHM